VQTPRPWRGLTPDLFRFATTDLHELRVAIMCVFDDTAVLQPALTFEQVRAGLAELAWDEPLDDAQLDQALPDLVGMGLVAIQHAPHHLHGALVGQELADLLLEQLLVV